MSDPFIGEIRMFAGTFAPMDWAFCDGQSLPIAGNDALFALIGTTYGGDGMNTFNVPDLRGRLPMHKGNGYVPGQMGGVEQVTLIPNQLPAHTHAAQASASDGNLSNPQNAVWAKTILPGYSSNAPGLTMKNSSVGSAGNNQPHDNIMPFQAVNFIISLWGIFPSRP